VLANTVALVVTSLALAVYVGWPYLVVAAPAGLGFLACTHLLRRRPTPERALLVFKLSGLYLLALLAGLALSALV
jgi:heme O synthase-like polyprenyltransferase